VAVHFSSLLLPEGWAKNVRAEISGGIFESLERDVDPQANDERVTVGLPGVCNVHSHGFQRGMAGLTEFRGPEADNFWSWRTLMYRFVARMTPEDLGAITAQAYVDMLEGGFTRVGEFHYVHHDPSGVPYTNPAETAVQVAAAAARTGIGLTLLPVFYAHGGFGGQKPSEGQRRFVTSVDEFARLLIACRKLMSSLEGATLGVAPHSLRAVSPEELAQIVTLAGAAPVHIHAAEQTGEVEQCLAWSGARPVQWLLDHAPVDRRWCLVHATHMTFEESRGLAARGAVAGLCPVTEANLGDGIFSAPAFFGAGGVFGIGTDSNVSIAVAEELRQLEYSQRLRDRARNVIGAADARSTGRVLFEGAVRGGAQALGFDGPATGIAAGATADFISLNLAASALASRADDALLDSLIFGAHHGCIDGVWRAGRKWVSEGRHIARDEVARAYRATLAKVLSGSN
jgi:formiminoglutamate deiminase